MGWVRAITVDPANQWFATGAGDRVIKVGQAHDMAWTCSLMLDLGSGFGRVEAVVDGTYIHCPWTRRIGQTSIHVFLC